MLALTRQQKYFQKEVVLPNGDTALVLFELVEQYGRVIARAVSAQIISLAQATAEVVCLPIVLARSLVLPVKECLARHLEPVLRDLFFITSQPTRAPAYVLA